jgi:hypothetical protein
VANAAPWVSCAHSAGPEMVQCTFIAMTTAIRECGASGAKEGSVFGVRGLDFLSVRPSTGYRRSQSIQ